MLETKMDSKTVTKVRFVKIIAVSLCYIHCACIAVGLHSPIILSYLPSLKILMQDCYFLEQVYY